MMSGDQSSNSGHSNLSPTTSLTSSLVSMNTEDHNELYDHRQHRDSMFRNAGNQQVPVGSPTIPQPARVRGSSIANARPSRLGQYLAHQGSFFDEDNPRNVVSGNSSSPSGRRGSKVASVGEAPNAKVNSAMSSQTLQKIGHASSGNAHGGTTSNDQRSRANSVASAGSANPKTLLTKTLSHLNGSGKQARRASFDSGDSKASRESQETEEDVCFPMPPQLHTRVNGIDFDELEEFAQASIEQNQYVALKNQQPCKEPAQNVTSMWKHGGSSSSTTTSVSSAAIRYTPKPSDDAASPSSQEEALAQAPGISFGANKVEEDEPQEKYTKRPYGEQAGVGSRNPPQNYASESYQPEFAVPNRFSFFSSESEETVHATDIASLVKPGEHFSELFRDGQPTWWLDCSCPTDDEMRCIAKAFGIHPLTAEDIRMQETREKVELFKSYYFVCFHTFESDNESQDFLEPINVYIIVFRSGVLTFHFGPISHCANVRRRVRQLRDYVDVSSDWICYAIIDDITDSFAPVIQSLEYEADAIEDSVFMARDLDFSVMLEKIGESRRKTMTLMRLLSGKADVIKMFAKRCQDEANGIGPALTSQINIANLQAGDGEVRFACPTLSQPQTQQIAQPRGDIALYLGDIQDHLLTMYQNLLAYEKIFARSHATYLAQLQVESFNSNNKVTEMLGKVTMLGTMLVPLNIIPGLFGMNVKVPGGGQETLGWWFGILGVMICLALTAWFAASYWIKQINPPKTLNEAAESGGKSVISSFFPKSSRQHQHANAHFSDPRFPVQKYPRGPLPSSNRSAASLPSKYSRYD
ncbi:hypothetical protein HG536_0E02410 [Torulaspora globosa]|uniref:Magnesium transporter n=1 Tax=Torulaspora globosa TaxID=48254 RepID=A0A7G3ZIJ4_9SACH|nr:uncharacterized protein HG536_0E02410 [Torulaspora globosa]QLL33330.1 hypothetical protein HG536_0E02410 [Torulaspora globosa]